MAKPLTVEVRAPVDGRYAEILTLPAYDRSTCDAPAWSSQSSTRCRLFGRARYGWHYRGGVVASSANILNFGLRDL
jgi:hypothetical protein